MPSNMRLTSSILNALNVPVPATLRPPLPPLSFPQKHLGGVVGLAVVALRARVEGQVRRAPPARRGVGEGPVREPAVKEDEVPGRHEHVLKGQGGLHLGPHHPAVVRQDALAVAPGGNLHVHAVTARRRRRGGGGERGRVAAHPMQTEVLFFLLPC